MKASQAADLVLVQAIESIDESGLLLHFEERREANEVLEGEEAGSPLEALSTRASLLLSHVEKRSPWLLDVSRHFASISWLFTGLCVVIAAVLGAGVQALGSGKTFHVLSLPLLALLAWSLVSLGLLSLVPFVWGRLGAKHTADAHTSLMAGLGQPFLRALLWLRRKLYRWRLPTNEERTQQVALRALQAFWQTWPSHARRLYQAQGARLLHLCAIAFCVSALAAAYMGGLTKAYLATNESTFLRPAQIQSLLEVLFLPSQWILGPLPSLQAGEKAIVGPAGPWIHHYTVMLSLFVLFPRLVLVGWTWMQSLWLSSRLPVAVDTVSLAPTLNLALASHTNVGKTSLARTLLRRDVGEVRDAEHVTKHRAGYYLVHAESGRLRLWDTPGFGDARALYQNLQKRQGWSWLRAQQDLKLHFDREAALSLQEEADLILYLVPARPTPENEQIIRDEWAVLSLIQRPVLCVLNRLEEASLAEEQELLAHWESFFADRPLCQAVLSLDAFSRSWKDELMLFAAIEEAVEPHKRKLAQDIRRSWEQQREQEHRSISAALASLLHTLSQDSESETGKAGMKRLKDRAQVHIQQGQQRLLSEIGLEGELRQQALADVEALFKSVAPDRGERKTGAIIGGILGGLATGLVTDILAGGLTFGGGAVLGAISGALGGAALGEGVRRTGDKALVWEEKALRSTAFQMTLLYLTAMSFGRARGVFTDAALPSDNEVETRSERHVLLQEAVEQALHQHWPYLWPLLAMAHETERGQLWTQRLAQSAGLPTWALSLSSRPSDSSDFNPATVYAHLETGCVALLEDAQNSLNAAHNTKK